DERGVLRVRHLMRVDLERVDTYLARRRFLRVVVVGSHPERASRDRRCARHYWPSVSADSSFAIAWSIVKLAAFCRGGNSLNVSGNWLTTNVAAGMMYTLAGIQS